jgi:hypothetical protein
MRIAGFIGTAVVVMAALLVAACTKHSNRFCCTTEESCAEFSGQPITPCTDPAQSYCDDLGEYGPRHACIPDPRICGSSAECIAPLICDIGETNMCVECTQQEAAACVGATPVCGDDRACRSCTSHGECPVSNACLPDGSCADAGQVAYVEPAPGGTDNNNCTQAMPCTVIAKAVATGRPYVKLKGTTDEQVTLNNRNVTLLADPSAKLTSTSNGILLRIDGTSQVSIYDLEISGASGGSGFGISIPAGATGTVMLARTKVRGNQAGGISAAGGTLTVTQSTISNNTGGGISMMNSTFVIVGNVFFQNGSLGGLTGGVAITAPASSTNRLEFNSFNQNATADAVAPGIQCTVAGGFTARNNIVSGNLSPTNMDQIGGNCSHVYSIVRPGVLPPGTGNSNPDPMFTNMTTGDLHLRAGSPASGAADPGSNLAGLASRDIDGDARTAPADIGADEIR